ncbi:MAG TPA: hypothetical protein VGO74_05420, partial [Modestobacter sp.]|nr:hypothetical protein [Modestobacter sp.]
MRGNHERQVLTVPPAGMGESDRPAHDTITSRHRSWLAGLPLRLAVADGVLAFHGSPTDDLTYLTGTSPPRMRGRPPRTRCGSDWAPGR